VKAVDLAAGRGRFGRETDPSCDASFDVAFGPATAGTPSAGWFVVSVPSPADKTCPVPALRTGDREVEQFDDVVRTLGRPGLPFGCRAGREPARWFARGSEAGRAAAGGADGDVDDGGDSDQPCEPANGHGRIQPSAAANRYLVGQSLPSPPAAPPDSGDQRRYGRAHQAGLVGRSRLVRRQHWGRRHLPGGRTTQARRRVLSPGGGRRRSVAHEPTTAEEAVVTLSALKDVPVRPHPRHHVRGKGVDVGRWPARQGGDPAGTAWHPRLLHAARRLPATEGVEAPRDRSTLLVPGVRERGDVNVSSSVGLKAGAFAVTGILCLSGCSGGGGSRGQSSSTLLTVAASSGPAPPTTQSSTTAPATPPPTPATTEPGVYIVQKGDSLTSIAKQFGVSVAQLVAANNIKNQDHIEEGERLTIPPAAVAPAPTAPRSTTARKPARTPPTTHR